MKDTKPKPLTDAHGVTWIIVKGEYKPYAR